jgi:hypothetical protein
MDSSVRLAAGVRQAPFDRWALPTLLGPRDGQEHASAALDRPAAPRALADDHAGLRGGVNGADLDHEPFAPQDGRRKLQMRSDHDREHDAGGRDGAAVRVSWGNALRVREQPDHHDEKDEPGRQRTGSEPADGAAQR